MERLPNRYPKISQSHKVPLYKGLSLFYPKLHKIIRKRANRKEKLRDTMFFLSLFTTHDKPILWLLDYSYRIITAISIYQCKLIA